MTQRAISVFAAAAFCALPLSARAGAADRAFERGRQAYFAARKVHDPAVRRTKLLGAANGLRDYLARYPGHLRQAEALFNLGAIYGRLGRDEGDREAGSRALHYYRELVRQAPRHLLADDALWAVGRICDEVFRDAACSRDARRRIEREYPSGDMIRRLRPAGEPRSHARGARERACAKEPAGCPPPPASEACPPDTTACPPGELAEVAGFDWTHEGRDLLLRLTIAPPRAVAARSLAADPGKNLPERFYVDVPGARLSDAVADRLFSADFPVSRVRFGQYDSRTVRVVLDLSPKVGSDRVTATPDELGLLLRVSETAERAPLWAGASPAPAPEVALSPAPEAADASPAAPAPPAQAIGASPAPAAPPEVAQNRRRGFRVVIDPGHGGEDHGARGPAGTLEKEVCLSMAKKLEGVLSKKPEYEVFLTRSDDRYLPLAERTRMANNLQGDLFVSIHANAAPRRSARGVSTYFLDNADDRESLRVAMRENAELYPPGESEAAAKTESYYLEIMKASMVKNFQTTQSTDLARFVQTQLVRDLSSRFRDVESLGVRSARFYVLTGANMPAILVETSFISNAVEEKRLRDPRYQSTIADAIARGLEKFLHSAKDHASLYRP